jgi:hypothetical protein
MTDDVSGGGPSIPRHHNAIGEANRHDGCRMGDRQSLIDSGRRSHWNEALHLGQRCEIWTWIFGRVEKRHAHAGEATGCTEIRLRLLLTALLHETTDKILGVGFQHLVDFIEKVVEFCLEFLAGLRTRWSLVYRLFWTLGWCSSDLFTFRHGTS